MNIIKFFPFILNLTILVTSQISYIYFDWNPVFLIVIIMSVITTIISWISIYNPDYMFTETTKGNDRID